MKILVLGVLVYTSKKLFFMVGQKWFEELQDYDAFSDRVDSLRTNFWKGFLISFVVVNISVAYMVLSGQLAVSGDLVIRLCAVVMALTASLGRGGWRIQSYGSNTVVERIDRGMFVGSQIGATVLLLLSLSL